MEQFSNVGISVFIARWQSIIITYAGVSTLGQQQLDNVTVTTGGCVVKTRLAFTVLQVQQIRVLIQ